MVNTKGPVEFALFLYTVLCIIILLYLIDVNKITMN